VQLEADENGLAHRPWQVLLYGRGTAEQRAWVFVLLCRQLGLDVVLLATNPPGVHAETGQGANRFEQNDDFHVVSRFTYPFQFPNGQFFEAGVQAISGRFLPSVEEIGGVTPVMNAPDKGFQEQRLGVHAVLFPQPFGLQAEWNWGRGPQLNEERMAIETASLNGGYVQAMYKLENRWGTWFPFVRWQYFDGALKFERNAPQNHVDDVEVGRRDR
jgi:hypothetical protein